VDGTEVVKLKVTKNDGTVEYHHLEAEHYLPITIKGTREFQGAPIEYTITFGDYKEVGGVLMPHSVQSAGMGGSNTVSIDKIELNIPLADDRFIMPEPTKEEKKGDEGKSDPEDEKDGTGGGGN